MSPSNLGVVASQISGHLVTSAYSSIATATVGSGGQSNITFSSIPSTYTHLQLRILAKGDYTAYSGNFNITFNGDSTATYSYHSVMAEPTTTYTYGYASQNYIDPSGGGMPASYYSPYFGSYVMDIFDYTNTNKYKTLRSLGGYENNSAGRVSFGSGNWRSTSAITSINLYTPVGPFSQYSSFALYGVK
jgi:hypothetical protein